MPLINYRKRLFRYYMLTDDDVCTRSSRAIWSKILNAWLKIGHKKPKGTIIVNMNVGKQFCIANLVERVVSWLDFNRLFLTLDTDCVMWSWSLHWARTVLCAVGPYTGHGLCYVRLVLTLDTDCVMCGWSLRWTRNVFCAVGPYTGHGMCYVWLVLTLDTDCVMCGWSLHWTRTVLCAVGPYTGHGLCYVRLVLTLDTDCVMCGWSLHWTRNVLKCSVRINSCMYLIWMPVISFHSLRNALLFLQPAFTWRISRHCLGTFRTLHSYSPP
jgi:hypothetical protein